MQRNLFLKLNKQLFCTIDEWIGMNVEMIRDIENEIQDLLNNKIKSDGSFESPAVQLSEASFVSK